MRGFHHHTITVLLLNKSIFQCICSKTIDTIDYIELLRLHLKFLMLIIDSRRKPIENNI